MDHCYYTSVVLMYILELNTICIHFYCMENCAELLLFSQDKENQTVSYTEQRTSLHHDGHVPGKLEIRTL